MDYIKIENLKINFERKGTGDKKIIFLHGNSGSLNYFDKQFEDENLLNSHELIRFDLPGCGLSEHASNRNIYSFPGLAQVFAKFYKQLKLDNAVLVGSSFGGNIILETLEKLQGVKGIMLVGSSPFGIPPAENIFLPHPALPLFFKGEHTTEELQLIAKVAVKETTHAKSIITELKKSDPNFRESLAVNLQKIVPKDELEIVKNTNVPIAALIGKDDEVMNFDYLNKISFKTLWQNKIIVIPEAGHLPFLEQSVIFNKHLSSFCSEVF